MPIEIIVALSNLKTVGRGLKKNLGDAKGTLPSPFFFPMVIHPFNLFCLLLSCLLNHLNMIIITFFTFDILLNAI